VGNNGIGRIDMIENRLVGIKSREIYESPAMVVLINAHRDLESLTLTADVTQYKRGIEETYTKLVYNGLWYSPLKSALDAFIQQTQERVSGVVRLKLFKGNLNGFFINYDARGYALKIKAGKCPLGQDWGGYYILSPEID
jgi:argininosuccinate synthase